MLNIKDSREVSPCLGCKYVAEDRLECMVGCERLSAFQSGKEYLNIVPHLEKETQAIGAEVLDKMKSIAEDSPSLSTANVEEKCLACGRPKCDHKLRQGLCITKCWSKWRNGIIKHPTLGVWQKMSPEQVSEGRRRKNTGCLIEGCEEIASRRGLCKNHYQQWRRGAILHPEIGDFTKKGIEEMMDKVVEKSNDVEKTVVHRTVQSEIKKITLDFTDYLELYGFIQDKIFTTLLPAKHIVMSLISRGLKCK